MEKVNFKPLNGKVLLELPEVKETTESGIIKSPELIATEKAETDDYVTVVAIADDVTKVKVGYRVLVGGFGEIRIDGKIYGITNEDMITGYKIKPTS